MFIILRIPDIEFSFNRTAPNFLAPHQFCVHNACVLGASSQFRALDEFISSTLLLWWIRRNLSRLRFFLAEASG